MALQHGIYSTRPRIPDPLIIRREFEASREDVFKAWIDHDKIPLWWGPVGFTTPHCVVDSTVGGTWHLCMRSPRGDDFWCVGRFTEVSPPHRLRMTDSFSDEEGNVVSPTTYGFNSYWPAESEVDVRFEEHDGRTLVTLEQSIPASTPEGIECRRGWAQSLERLSRLVEGPDARRRRMS